MVVFFTRRSWRGSPPGGAGGGQHTARGGRLQVSTWEALSVGSEVARGRQLEWLAAVVGRGWVGR